MEALDAVGSQGNGMIKSDAPSPEATGTPGVDPLIGRTLNGRFSILEPIGVGGMGKVYKAVQAPLDRVVALKVLNPNFPQHKDPGFQQRFFLEASLTSKLRHPNTVTVIDYGQTDDGIYYIAMEYLEGQDAGAGARAAGPLPWTRGCSTSASRSAARCARRTTMGIVHRDLKPANMMLLERVGPGPGEGARLRPGEVLRSAPTGDGARSARRSPRAACSSARRSTWRRSRRATSADPRSDVYSLGVVLYQMLQGRPPFIARRTTSRSSSGTLQGAAAALQLAAAAPPRAARRSRRWCMQCLEKDPARRYQSMDEVLEAMRAANMAAGGHSGIFKRPGGATTGPHPSPLFAGSPVRTTPTASTLALDISVEVPEAVAKARRRKLMAMAGPVRPRSSWAWWRRCMLMRRQGDAGACSHGAAGSGGGPAPATPKPAPAEPAEPTTQMVRFRLMSEPTGARVFYQGKERGTTPFVLEIPAGGDGTVTAELAFALEGYQTETVMTGGSGDVVLSQKLQKRRADRPAGQGRVRQRDAAAGLEPAAAMPTSLDPAESLAPATPPPPRPRPRPRPRREPMTAPDTRRQPRRAGARRRGVLAAAGNRPLPYGEGMSRPEQLDGKEIAYTREALAAKVQGVMLVRCTITSRAAWRTAASSSRCRTWSRRCVEALQSRVYKPILYKGQPVAVDYVFNIKL